MAIEMSMVVDRSGLFAAEDLAEAARERSEAPRGE